MQVILLEPGKLGKTGDVVNVKDGYARNWLIPQGKATPATTGNMKTLEAQLRSIQKRQAQEKNIQLADNAIDDVLTVALFPQVGLKFLENRHNPAAFEPLPQVEAAQPVAKAEKPAASGVYTVEVEGRAFVVKVSDGGDISPLTAAAPVQATAPAAAPAGAGTGFS